VVLGRLPAGRKLTQAGVRVTSVRYSGTIHDFVLLNPISETPAVRAGVARARSRATTFAIFGWRHAVVPAKDFGEILEAVETAAHGDGANRAAAM
jgi:acetyl esterase/lipase